MVLVAASGGALAWEWAKLPAELVSAGRILSAGVFFALVTAFLSRLALDGIAARGQRSESAKAAALDSGP